MLIGAFETSREMERQRRIEDSQGPLAEEVEVLKIGLALSVRVIAPRGKKHTNSKLRKRKIQSDRKFKRDLEEAAAERRDA